MTMRTLALSGLLALSCFAQAEDIIYKKDGSILKGTITEQDFESGTYKIRLAGGSLFAVKQEDISRIEHDNTEAELEAVAAESRAKLQPQTPTATAAAAPAQQPTYIPLGQSPYSPYQQKEVQHVFYVGLMGKTITFDSGYNDVSYRYSGLNLAYQYNFSKHVGIYTGLNTGSLSTIEEDGVDYDYDGPDVDYSSLEVNVLLSTNLYKGWQFYTGLGAFSESFSAEGYEDDDYQGTNFVFGMGYDWGQVQAQLRVAIQDSSDYEDDETNTSSALQVGFNF